jgi:hypothetical protein
MVPKPTTGRILRWFSSMSRAAGIRITSFARTARDPILPLLILGVFGVALFASFILKASDDIVFGIVFIGCLTAFLENQDAQRQSGIGERRPAALDRIAHRSHEEGGGNVPLLIQVARCRGCPTCVKTAWNRGRLPCSFCDHLSHCGDIQR